MKQFNRKDWFLLMNRIQHLKKLTLEESYNRTDNVVNIRHDVDDNLAASCNMAELEYANGIESTYFILDTAPYWRTSSLHLGLLYLVNHGHNLGWHNNAISNHLMTGISIENCIKAPLSMLRRYDDVIGTASHGDSLCHQKRYLNYYVFGFPQHDDFPNTEIRGDHFALSYFDLAYEAYHTGHTHYISDSGGQWHQDNEAVISDFEKNGGKLQILIHPQHWQL